MIDLGDGLQAEEVIEIARRIDIKRMLSPQLQEQLAGGIDALLMAEPIFNSVPPWLMGLLPVPAGFREKLSAAVVLARIARAVLE